ncbi:MAG: SpoIIE family protein phosphatase [Planctomycetota bacterium]
MTEHRESSRADSRRSTGGMNIAPRFAIATTAVLAVVLVGFSYLLLNATNRIVEGSVHDAQTALASASAALEHGEVEFEKMAAKGPKVGPHLVRVPVTLKGGRHDGATGEAFLDMDAETPLTLLTPDRHSDEDPVRTLYALFIALTAVALIVTGAVAFMVASRVSRPIATIVDDVRTIANGRLDHRCRARGGGEVGLLAGAIDRMTASLRDAQDAEVELSVREREREVALEVQHALHGADVEAPDGYSVAAEQVTCDEPGGDFHGAIAADDGRSVFFVCDVSGKGVPGAIVGAMARAYLKSELEAGGPLDEALKVVNRTLSRELRRGMFVTALCVALDPATGDLEVCSAGHKLPLVHRSAADGRLRTLSGDGFALGFDKGPVFDKSIQAVRAKLEPGDSVLLSGTGAVAVVDDDANELGEKRLYKLFARNGDDPPADALDGVLTAIEAFAGDTPFPTDFAALVLARR